MAVAVLLVLAVCLKGATSQLPFASVTDPPTSDANPAVIAEPENATDVSIFCHAVRDGGIVPRRGEKPLVFLRFFVFFNLAQFTIF